MVLGTARHSRCVITVIHQSLCHIFHAYTRLFLNLAEINNTLMSYVAARPRIDDRITIFEALRDIIGI